ncbi:MAG: transposase zinc-binding domain-containing protein [Smithella sp.]
MRTAGGFEVADIFRQQGTAYRSSHRLPRNHLRVMRAIESCRTATLGGHKEVKIFCQLNIFMWSSPFPRN